MDIGIKFPEFPGSFRTKEFKIFGNKPMFAIVAGATNAKIILNKNNGLKNFPELANTSSVGFEFSRSNDLTKEMHTPSIRVTSEITKNPKLKEQTRVLKKMTGKFFA